MKRYLLPLAALLLSATALAACSAPPAPSDTTAPTAAATAVADGSAMTTTIDYLDAGLPDLGGATIAYLTECATANAYCQTRLDGAQEMADEANAELVVFDANFDPATQLSQVQDAVQRGFDGYLFSPVASTSGCADLDVLLDTGKPVATINSPVCGNPDYTEGTVGFVAMQTESFFTEHVMNAFASCDGECEAVAVGGFVGSDLFTRWESAIAAAAAEYPNVTVVSDQPGNFDPATALTVVQDAIAANPDVSIVVSSWDDMTRGVEQAITASGKTPGTDVRIYSVGGTTDGVAKVADGTWSGTSVLLPYEESAYGFVQLARAIDTGEPTPGFTFLGDAPVVVDGPGSIFVTSDNAATFTPEY
ncbi:sugar ABC transporter substrate-binding protein [Microbacterium chocolatum]|uniref:sugar ABC transporter substrate-binding protein n=1 Tax=Microbacterium aurantiacum TaxID=162393 RepID=UPI00338F771F